MTQQRINSKVVIAGLAATQLGLSDGLHAEEDVLAHNAELLAGLVASDDYVDGSQQAAIAQADAQANRFGSSGCFEGATGPGGTPILPELRTEVSLRGTTEVPLGAAFEARIEVSNTGGDCSPITNVAIQLPDQVELVDTVGCEEDPNGIPDCAIGAVIEQETVAVDLRLRATAPANNIAVTAMASSSVNEVDPNNNAGSQFFSIAGVPIPTLNQTGQWIAALLLGLFGVVTLRRWRRDDSKPN